MVKICYVNPTILMRRPISQITKILSKSKNYEINVLTPRKIFKDRDTSLHHSNLENINVITYPCINPPIQSEWPIPGFKFIIKAIKILKENDIIHMWVPFYISSNIIILLNHLFFKKKIILTMDTVPGYSFKMTSLMNLFFKIYYKTVGKFIFSSINKITLYGDSFKKYAKKASIPLDKVIITPTGINSRIKKSDKDIRKEFNIKKDERIVLYVGLLVPRKGIDTLIKTANILRDEKIKFILVGDGPNRERYEKLVNNLDLHNKIIFTGFRKDVYNFYNQADLFFFPSRGEGLAGVLMEASVYNLAIVASDIPGNRDIIENNKTGYLCNLENINEYVSGIKKLLDNPKIYKQFIKKQKEKIRKEFNLENTIEKLKKLYFK